MRGLLFGLQITIQIWARGILKETSKSTQIKSSSSPIYSTFDGAS